MITIMIIMVIINIVNYFLSIKENLFPLLSYSQYGNQKDASFKKWDQK